MRKGKRFVGAILAVMMTASLVSCGKEADNNNTQAVGNTVTRQEENTTAKQEETTTEKVDALEAAKKNMENITSMETKMVMDMDMKISAEGQEQAVASVTTMDMVCFSDPFKIKMDMTMDMGELGSVTQTIYGDVAEDGTAALYLNDGTGWQTQTVAVGDMDQYDARSNILSVIEDGVTYTMEGTEQVDGANAVKYSHVMQGDEMKESLLSSGALDSVASLGLDASQMEGMLDGLGEMTEYIWIDEATLYPVKYEVDMTEIMDKLMANVVEALGDQAQGMSINIPKMKMSMTCSNYNSAADFTIPEEAKAN